MNILILGGTTEASALARALEDAPPFRPILSLAGRTRAPTLPAIPSRRGGFGGIPGLIAYLQSERIDAIIDATHPFAAQMHANAAAAAQATSTPRLVLLRPPWHPTPEDLWTQLPTMEAAVEALGPTPRRVFLTVGQQELAPFQVAPHHHYLIRSVEPPDPASLPPNTSCITARGPFHEPGERALLQSERIDIIVSKNSGGTAVEAKLAAARTLQIPILMVARPPEPAPPIVATVPEALAWLHHQARLPPKDRGV